MATLSLLTSRKILLFREHPKLHETMQDEFDRLKRNLEEVEAMRGRYEEHRKGLECIGALADIATQEEILGSIRRLTIHIEKDIEHEQADLEVLRARWLTAM
jgi:hypothetical protein